MSTGVMLLDAAEKWKHSQIGMGHSTDAIYVVDRVSMRIIDANETACSMLGYMREEMLQLSPYQTCIGIGEGRLEAYYDAVASCAAQESLARSALRHKDGTHLQVELHTRALRSGGQLVMVVLIKDPAERLQSQAALRASEERFNATFNQAAVGLAHTSLDGRWLRANRKLLQIIGHSIEELLGMTMFEVIHGDDVESVRERLQHSMAGDRQSFSFETRYRRKDGGDVWVCVTVSLVPATTGAPSYFIAAIEDISLRKRMESALRYSAYHDALTDLPNRTLLLGQLSQAIVDAHRTQQVVAVMLVDLDRFKNINDSLGHDVGDQVIIEVGHRLSRNAHDGDTVARLGSDEFVVILANIGQEENVEQLAQQALLTLAEPLIITGQELYPSGSIGISLYPKDGNDAPSLLRNADRAMYQAKERGGNNFQFYAKKMNACVLERLQIDARLRRALDQDEFVLHYQPQVEIATGRIVGVEALVRWQPQDGPMVAPSYFIPIAEESGLIVPIGEWVLRTACAQGRKWQQAGLPAVRTAVNLSARQFGKQDILTLVSHVLQETGSDAGSLELEITESVIMKNAAAAVETLSQLNEMGVSLSIDDFGTGYSSLNYLHRFPIHTLKIDRSFISDIVSEDDDAPIAKSVILLAHSMNLHVVAEGVETEEQLAFLRKHDCDQIQGYYFSPPVPAAQIEDLLRANQALRDMIRIAPGGKIVSAE